VSDKEFSQYQSDSPDDDQMDTEVSNMEVDYHVTTHPKADVVVALATVKGS